MTCKNRQEFSDSVNLGSNPSSPATGNAGVSGISSDPSAAEKSEIAEQIADTGRTKVGTARKIDRLDVDRLREVLDYDPDTGAFVWKVRLSPRGTEGSSAGSTTASGYHRIAIDGVVYFSHHLAWLYHYGVPPKGDLDHRNTLTADNRIENLREATMLQNARNRNPRTQFKGVRLQAGRYHASIRPGPGDRIYLGSYATAEEAAAVYQHKAAELHGEFMRIKMTTFETRQQLRTWAKDKPFEVRNHVWVLCAQLWQLDGHPSPMMRGVVANSMDRLKEISRAA